MHTFISAAYFCLLQPSLAGLHTLPPTAAAILHACVGELLLLCARAA